MLLEQSHWTPASVGATDVGAVKAAGALAHAALSRSGGRLRPLPAFPDSPYLLAGDDIVWLGGEGGTWHPRRILLAKPRLARVSSQLLVSVEGASVWQPVAAPRLTAAQGAAACGRIGVNIGDIGIPAGFGLLLAGAPLAFPLDRAPAKLDVLAASLARDDAPAFASAALPLLGLGLGLTPSGDDLVGACLFARRLCGDTPAWQAAAENLAAAAALRSNSISAALFGDLVRCAAYAPLHDLAVAMGGSDAELFAAARALCAIGHSSGWDMLTGFLLGAGGTISWKAAPDSETGVSPRILGARRTASTYRSKRTRQGAFQPTADFNGI